MYIGTNRFVVLLYFVVLLLFCVVPGSFVCCISCYVICLAGLFVGFVELVLCIACGCMFLLLVFR